MAPDPPFCRTTTHTRTPLSIVAVCFWPIWREKVARRGTISGLAAGNGTGTRLTACRNLPFSSFGCLRTLLGASGFPFREGTLALPPGRENLPASKAPSLLARVPEKSSARNRAWAALICQNSGFPAQKLESRASRNAVFSACCFEGFVLISQNRQNLGPGPGVRYSLGCLRG